ncbi:hypothetical protein A3C26_01870 [Candidatus Daviesbacteria bacterium RIFCSPHIGHO2_02_FULL_39_12]|uniref:Transposase IS30-like HTH domain-containing protein n=2 Tax=Candidatus Daviesiibacteriota TaxID=1752718 RepID=A0A1F5JD03_9BACT|nr:MAG: hypothetical protein A3C26_01870 [Candidatus Daviesbacteria bacterium RIFCSPHIGHO2_02_FULL_39_12]OGE71527.1 MAG: hypothetical protein A3H40_00685 [Candidatus Daviesbacteria bacterium RIFCSPLOWO2_02_FULL_38_15]
MYQQITIQTLFKQGEKKSRIASQLGCHRNTVLNIVKRDKVIEKQKRVRSSIFDPYKQKISEYLDKKISRLRIFELLGDEYGVSSTYINMKTAILKNQHYDLEFNQDFLEFAGYYNTVILPCTPYSPQQKGTVESGIKYLQSNFAAGRQFQDDADIKDSLEAGWMVMPT